MAADPEALAPELVAGLLSESLEAPYRYVGPFAGGETGAFELRGPEDEPLVLKWKTGATDRDARADAVALTERLRTRGDWPVPRQRLIELPLDGDRCQIIVQHVLPGRPMDTLHVAATKELLALLSRSRGLGVGTRCALRERIVATLVDGGNGYCHHEPLRSYDVRTRRLIERIEALGQDLQELLAASARSNDHPAEPTDEPQDIVHYDLHPGNVLELGGHVSGIIDTEYATVGDGGFDLVTLAVSAGDHDPEPGIGEHLWDLVDRQVPEPWRRAYVAHLLLRNIDWTIRNHSGADLDRWLTEADRHLADW